tara:strand:- start:96784 stop:97938 length:1155 start_codon:yes stop_codon:yes gene_type:complete
MHINLFDPLQIRENLLPFTFTRPVACIRVGILTIAEKWEKYGFHVGFETQDYLGKKFEALPTNVKVNGALCPSKELSEAILALTANTKLVSGDTVFAVSGDGSEAVNFEGTFRMINQPWEIFQFNKEQIEADFILITKGRISQPITDPHTVVYGKENVFLEEGATIRAAIINAENGPVYIGKNAHVHEGAIISGAFALCEGAHVNMGAKMKGDSTVGPHSKVGGEVSNSVIFGFSNKGHDGFLGNSVVGEWCNLGADTNTSNLKNNYAPVKLWNYTSERFVQTGLQFCGLMMGDHAKCSINTMFNTGTVVGVGSNIFGAGFPKNFIPSFSWGGSSGLITFQPRKFYEVAEAVMQRRGMIFDDTEKEIIDRIFEITTQYRTWDKK